MAEKGNPLFRVLDRPSANERGRRMLRVELLRLLEELLSLGRMSQLQLGASRPRPPSGAVSVVGARISECNVAQELPVAEAVGDMNDGLPDRAGIARFRGQVRPDRLHCRFLSERLAQRRSS